MSSFISVVGDEIAPVLRETSLTDAILPIKIQTAQDVITVLRTARPEQPISMLQTTVGHLSTYIGMAPTELPLEIIQKAMSGFRKHLRSRKLAKASVRAYCNYAGMLLRLAEELGWERHMSRAEREWKKLLAHFTLPAGCSSIVDYAIAHEKSHLEVSDKDLQGWALNLIEQGGSQKYAEAQIWNFRKAIKKAQLGDDFPRVSPSAPQVRYGIPVEKMPEPMRSEVRELLRWKQAEYAPDRPRKGKIRAVSAKSLEGFITRLYGYAIGTLKRSDISRLTDLVNKEIVQAYTAWAINDKKLRPSGLNGLARLCAAVKQHPDYQSCDFVWFTQLVNNLPMESKSKRNQRKAAKFVPYEDLSKIPDQMAQKRRKMQKGTKRYAVQVRDALMLLWLLILPWRQRNLREAILASAEEGGNIFKSNFLYLGNANLAKPDWVQEELSRNPEAEFWQIFFTPEQTKCENEVRGVVPIQLISLLEEWIDCRQLLVGDNDDPGTLFVTYSGRPMSATDVDDRIGDITARYARWTTPHMFRDSYAYRWLEAHPEDFLTLSKILWHKNVKHTIETYGSNYDESHGIKRAQEEWLD